MYYLKVFIVLFLVFITFHIVFSVLRDFYLVFRHFHSSRVRPSERGEDDE